MESDLREMECDLREMDCNLRVMELDLREMESDLKAQALHQLPKCCPCRSRIKEKLEQIYLNCRK